MDCPSVICPVTVPGGPDNRPGTGRTGDVSPLSTRGRSGRHGAHRLGGGPLLGPPVGIRRAVVDAHPDRRGAGLGAQAGQRDRGLLGGLPGLPLALDRGQVGGVAVVADRQAQRGLLGGRMQPGVPAAVREGLVELTDRDLPVTAGGGGRAVQIAFAGRRSRRARDAGASPGRRPPGRPAGRPDRLRRRPSRRRRPRPARPSRRPGGGGRWRRPDRPPRRPPRRTADRRRSERDHRGFRDGCELDPRPGGGGLAGQGEQGRHDRDGEQQDHPDGSGTFHDQHLEGTAVAVVRAGALGAA